MQKNSAQNAAPLDALFAVLALVAVLAGVALVVITGYTLVLFAVGESFAAAGPPPSSEAPEVSVLIAAPRVSPALEETLRRVDAIDYPNKSVLVALGAEDAGARPEGQPSPDVVFEAEGEGGKARTLNSALRRTKELVLLLDEDSQVERDCLRKMVPFFREDRVWAAVGVPYPSNPEMGYLQRTLWLEAGAWASVARAKDRLGLLLPATGFFALVRRSSLEGRPGTPVWDEEALAEDTELSVRQYAKGWRTRLSSATVGIEAPLGLGALVRQRLRWYKGLFDALWKNVRLVAGLPLTKGADTVLTLLAPLAPAGFVVLLLLSPLWPGLLVPVALGFVALYMVAGWLASAKLAEGRASVVLFSVPYALIQGAVALAALGAFLLHIRVSWKRTPKAGDRK